MINNDKAMALIDEKKMGTTFLKIFSFLVVALTIVITLLIIL